MSIKVLYCSPNKSHHYGYAEQLQRAGMLHVFVSGFARFGPGALLPELGNRLIRADLMQLAFLASVKGGVPRSISGELCYRSKLLLDNACKKRAGGADLFLYYSGCGLETAARIHRQGGKNMVEAVNCHVQSQREILEEEHRRLGLPTPYVHREEFRRRMEEYEQADGILLPSESVRSSFLQKGFPADMLIKLPYRPRILSAGGVTPSPSEHGRPFRILYVGSVQPRKGVRYLIEAFASLSTPGKELWIVGASPIPLDWRG